jgi:hypothetical protein
VLEGEPASYAAGNYTFVLDGVTVRPAPGGQAAAGFTPDDAGSITRNNLAAYVDVAWDPTSRTTISAAARFEHYDDASGDTLIGKVTGRQELTDWLSVRGAVSTGFRAPALAQQLYASTTGQFRTLNGQLNLLFIKTLPVESPAARALGSQPLQPETSTNLSAGFVLQPLDGLTITRAVQVRALQRAQTKVVVRKVRLVPQCRLEPRRHALCALQQLRRHHRRGLALVRVLAHAAERGDEPGLGAFLQPHDGNPRRQPPKVGVHRRLVRRRLSHERAELLLTHALSGQAAAYLVGELRWRYQRI